MCATVDLKWQRKGLRVSDRACYALWQWRGRTDEKLGTDVLGRNSQRLPKRTRQIVRACKVYTIDTDCRTSMRGNISGWDTKDFRIAFISKLKATLCEVCAIVTADLYYYVTTRHLGRSQTVEFVRWNVRSLYIFCTFCRTKKSWYAIFIARETAQNIVVARIG